MPDPQYVIFVSEKDDSEVTMSAPLEKADRAYLLDHVAPALRPMTDEDYMQGPAVILHTMARYSYVLHGQDVYWCAEWEPGLVVVRFSPDGSLAAAAFRSPIPNFGGRKASREEMDAWDEDSPNYQYNLVFRAWDAQFEEFWRKHRKFKPIAQKAHQLFDRALAHVNQLGDVMQERYEKKLASWSKRGIANVKKWAGEGLRDGAPPKAKRSATKKPAAAKKRAPAKKTSRKGAKTATKKASR